MRLNKGDTESERAKEKAVLKSKLIGKMVYITDEESFYYGEWGIVAHYDGERYHIRIANGSDVLPIFDRKQFRVKIK